MCQYITITLPRETRLDEVQSLFDRFEMSQHLIHNAHLQSQIESDYYYINTTSRMCDCDSLIASNAQHLNEKEKYASDIKRKKKRGWSDTKISRWIKQKENSGRNEELKQDNERWQQFLKELLTIDQIGKVGVLIHWYDLGLEDELIDLREKRKIKFSDLSEDTLENLEYDILYEFVR